MEIYRLIDKNKILFNSSFDAPDGAIEYAIRIPRIYLPNTKTLASPSGLSDIKQYVTSGYVTLVFSNLFI